MMKTKKKTKKIMLMKKKKNMMMIKTMAKIIKVMNHEVTCDPRMRC